MYQPKKGTFTLVVVLKQNKQEENTGRQWESGSWYSGRLICIIEQRYKKTVALHEMRF